MGLLVLHRCITYAPGLLFFNDTATTEISTLALHDALPIFGGAHLAVLWAFAFAQPLLDLLGKAPDFFVARQNTAGDIVLFSVDRKSTRLNSSHANISYAVFCLTKKKVRTSRWAHT